MLSYLRLPTDVAVAERQQRDLPQPQDNSACHAKVQPIGRDSPPQEMETDGPAGIQIRESSQPGLSRRSAKPQMGNRYLLYSYQTRCIVLIHDPRSVRQQHCGLQDRNGTKRESGSGYHSSGNTQRKEEGRRGVAAPQRPRLSIRFTSIFQADSTIRHYAFDVKTWEPV